MHTVIHGVPLSLWYMKEKLMLHSFLKKKVGTLIRRYIHNRMHATKLLNSEHYGETYNVEMIAM